jgi:hypothetical protein
MDNGTLATDLTYGQVGRRVKAKTNRCWECGQESYVILLESQLNLWKEGGALIQEAFPNLTPAERDLLLLGIHPECWEVFMSRED